MAWLSVLPSALLALIGASCLGLAWSARRRRDRPGAVGLAGLCLALAVWTIAYAVQLQLGGIAAQLLCTKVVYVGVVATPVAWLLFAARYGQQDGWVNRWTLALLALVPATTLGLAWTNEAHGLLWREVRQVSGPHYTTLALSYGPWFGVHTAFSYSLLLIGTAVLTWTLGSANQLHRRQALALLVSVLMPWVANALHLSKLSPIYPLDITPFMFGLSALSLSWALSRQQLLTVLPVAYSRVIGSISDAVVVLDPRGRTVVLNPAAEALLGVSGKAAAGRPLHESMAALPEVAEGLAATGRVELALTRRVAGQPQHLEGVVLPLDGGGGQLAGRLLLLRDVTRQRRAVERQRFLAEASALLASSLEYEATLATIARLAVPTLADLCAIHLSQADGTLRRVALTAVDPAAQALIAELDDRYPPPPDAAYGYPLAIRSGQVYFEPAIEAGDLLGFARDARHLALLEALQICSSLAVPLAVHDRTLGALTLLTTVSGRRCGPEDVELALDVARRAALAVEHARLVADLRASEARARAANDAAAAANQAKSLFLAHTSHEIRTPLTGILGVTDLLGETRLDAQQQRLVEMLQSSANSLIGVIDDILDLSRIESGRLELVQAPIDLVACVEEAMDLVAIPAADQDLDLSYTFAPGTPAVVMGDYGRLRQILVNLLSNAIKFTPRGSVALTVEAVRPLGQGPGGDEPWVVLFAVRDTGIGIALEQQAWLFESFSQVLPTTLPRPIGSGLGLAISKRLAELMGGSIGVMSEPRRGSIFQVAISAVPRPDLAPAVPLGPQPALAGRRLLVIAPPLPGCQALIAQAHSWGMRARAVAPDELAGAGLAEGEAYDLVIVHGAAPARDPALLDGAPGAAGSPLILLLPLKLGRARLAARYDGSTVLTLPLKYSQLLAALQALLHAPPAPAAAGAGPAAPGPAGAGLRVLLAEDDEVNRLVLVHMLSRAGHGPRAVASGAEALGALAEGGYDLALLDLQLPELDGIAVASRLTQARPPAARPYLVALTAFATPEQRQAALAAGFDEFLSKPTSDEALAALFQRAEAWLAERRAAGQAPPVDLARLRRTLGADADAVLGQLIATYLSNTPPLLAALRAALAAGDLAALGALHRLRSSSASVTADRLARLCAELEQGLRAGEGGQWPAALARIEAAYAEVERALRGQASRAA